jgi:hypothetical protein
MMFVRPSIVARGLLEVLAMLGARLASDVGRCPAEETSGVSF